MGVLNTIGQYENRNDDKIPNSNTKFADKILLKFAERTMFGRDDDD